MTKTPTPKAAPRHLADGTYIWEAYNTLSGQRQTFSATVHDGELVGFYIDCTGAAGSQYEWLQPRVFALISKALLAGKCVALLRPAPKGATIGVKEGYALHLTFVDLGIKDHKGFASAVLGRRVEHFRDLTPAEAREVRMAAVRTRLPEAVAA